MYIINLKAYAHTVAIYKHMNTQYPAKFNNIQQQNVKQPDGETNFEMDMWLYIRLGIFCLMVYQTLWVI